jgi:potassium-transporting ATPase KdpC subunit
MLLVFTLLFGTIYPLLVTCVAQWLFPFQSNGSLLTVGENIVGSLWVGQQFEHPAYFWGRPSVRLYQDDVLMARDVSWLGDEKWKSLTNQQQQKFNHATLPLELETASASAVDPHVSPEAIHIQLERVAHARHLSVEELRQWVQSYIESPFLGVWGPPRVNVLRLNLAMDHQWGRP